MGDADRTKQPWERQVRETIRAYAAFCVYRNMGVERSLTNAVRQYLTGSEADKRAPKHRREQRRYKAHVTPGKYMRNVRRRWAVWSSRHSWVARCEAFDDWLHEQTESERIESQLRIRREQIDLDESQAKSRLGQLRLGRATAAAFFEKLGKAFVPVEKGGTGEFILMSAKDMLQHAGKVGSLLIGCVAEERRELATLDPKKDEVKPAGVETEEVHELAREILAEVRRQRDANGDES